MTPKESISGFISPSDSALGRLCASLALAVALAFGGSADMRAQGKLFAIQKDSVAFFQGLQVSVDIAGPVIRAVSDYGEYEAALKANLHNQYFPTIEIGIGSAEHDDIVTGNYYKTSAPFFRIGCDLNLACLLYTSPSPRD